MLILRRSLLGLIVILLPTLLYVLALNVSLLKIVGSPEPIKSILAESGIYNSVVPSLLEHAEASPGSTGSINLTDPAVQSAAKAAISPEFLQQQTEGIIDSIYQWLEGETPVPGFYVDLTGVKNVFVDNLAQSVQARLGSLPVCTGTQPASFDAFSATCLPKGLSAQAAAGQVRSEVLNSENFLEEPVITADELKDSGSAQSVFTEQLSELPDVYAKAKQAPYVLGLLILVAIAGVIFLSPNKLKGVRRVGIILAVAGVFMLLLAWGINKVVVYKAVPNMKFDNAALQSEARTLVTDTTQKIINNFWMFGGIYTAAGVAAIAGSVIVGRRSSHTEAGGGSAKKPEHPGSPPAV